MSKKKTHDEFINEVYNLVGDEYLILSKYINAKEKIQIKHNDCGFEYETKPNTFLSQGSRCPKCFGLIQKTQNEFVSEIFDLVGDKYEILGEYINNKTKIKIKHNICNYEFNVIPSNFIKNNSRCPKCAYKIKNKDTNYFKQEIYNLVGDEYIVLGEYVENKSKIKIKHNTCNFKYEVAPNNFLSNESRCPNCSKSKGEKKISQYLDNLNITYKQEHRFTDCRNKIPLPFDFAIFNNNNELQFLIEFDGEFHFENTRADKFIKKHNIIEGTIQRDKIKNEYCKVNNIPLIRIPYFQKDRIEEILNRRLSRLIKK